MGKNSYGLVKLGAACQVLVSSRKVQALIKNAVGVGRFSEALQRMKAGKLAGPLGADIEAALIDVIHNESDEIWSGLNRQPRDNYPLLPMAQ